MAFPDDEYMPAEPLQRAPVTGVPAYVLLELEAPEGGVAFRRVGEAAALVAMPEAPVNEDGDPPSNEDHVWPARQVVAT